MELRLSDRDYLPDGNGGLVSVAGWEERLERILFQLVVRRGSFSFLPELGSNLHTLLREKRMSISNESKLILMLLAWGPHCEALCCQGPSFCLEARSCPTSHVVCLSVLCGFLCVAHGHFS